MRKSSAAPYLAACALVFAVFAVLQAVRPYYFLQDDNRDSFLPFFVHNYRALADGQLAQFNFYQSLGKPHLSSGWPAVLQPINYVAVFLSELLFDHVFAAIDIFTLLHLLLGACGTVFLVRLAGSSSAAAVFAAVAWCFSPFNMMTSQSWSTYPPVIGLLPWIVAGCLLVWLERYRSGIPIFVLSHVALFYVGAPQFFLYAAFIEAAILLWLGVGGFRAKRIAGHTILRTLGVFALLSLFVTALCMPLLLPMWQQMQISHFRGEAMSYIELSVCSIAPLQLVNGFFAPWSSFYVQPNGAWCETYLPGSFTHVGYLAMLFAFAYPFARKRIDVEQRRTADAIFVAGVVLLVAAMGALTPILASVPVVNRLRWPFKYFGFAHLLLMVSCAPAFDALVARVSKKLLAAAALIIVQAANLALVDLSFPRQAFLEHLDPVPLVEPLKPMFAPHRTVALGCHRAEKLRTAASLGYDYATLWELHYFGGYDPLVPVSNFRLSLWLEYQASLCGPPEILPLDYLRFWGVRYYIIKEPFGRLYEPMLTQRGLRRVHADRDRVVMENPAALPLVGSGECTQRGLGRDGDDLTATVDCRADSVVTMRFLYHPFFSATIDGQPAAIAETGENQVAIRVPRGTHTIQLSYADPLTEIGFWIALFSLAVAGAIFVLRRR